MVIRLVAHSNLLFLDLSLIVLLPGPAHMLFQRDTAIGFPHISNALRPPPAQILAVELAFVGEDIGHHVLLYRLPKGGDAPAPILLLPALQNGLFLRRQVEGEFLFFAHNGSFPKFDPCFFLVGVSIGE